MAQCHARGCKESISPSLLMCLTHWSMVPNGIKSEVNRTWRSFMGGRGKKLEPQKRADALRSYQEARAKAIAAVANQEGFTVDGAV